MHEIAVCKVGEYSPDALEELIAGAGYRVFRARDLLGLRGLLSTSSPAVLLLDGDLIEGDGERLLEELHQLAPSLQVIVMRTTEKHLAARTGRSRAFADIAKLISKESLLRSIDLAVQENLRAVRHRSLLQPDLRSSAPRTKLLGVSGAMLELNGLLEKVAKATDTPVLILGESGTGKELAASAIHYLSSRRASPFIRFNCAVIPPHLVEIELFGQERTSARGEIEVRKGLFELAEGGTIFLDEIGELDIAVQPRLLRVLQDKTFARVGAQNSRYADVRVVAASNRNLVTECQRKSFREDLYFRIAVMQFRMPPLRDRIADIRPLAEHFLAEKNAQLGKTLRGFAPRVIELFEHYAWPGNVRELRNMVERLCILSDGDRIDLDEQDFLLHTFPVTTSAPVPVFTSAEPANALGRQAGGGLAAVGQTVALTLAEMEREHINAMLRACENNRSECARRLGISRSTLLRKLSEAVDSCDEED